ncbi:hypothetical protein ADIAL_2099 [Alkalibacterium sp. AK22]|uniref:late competence development ComFB family protein n=1 Tax=Alkalibacterium sp. AK22 TaxID=1229520 RepID=UPI000451FCE6|nr:competence protein ComFB [Alkalibacterium sp. AK22]EXJ22513.1 hypothetical protein ADIAL_2099 [Alkalibacterium sp. AK22]
MVENYMESLVDRLLPSLVEENKHILACQKCQDDVKAIALNNLKPVYVVTDKGSLYAKTKEFDPQFQVDVQKEIIQAIDKVMSHPQHAQ